MEKSEGGLSMIDIHTIIQTSRIKLIYKILHSETETWNIIGKYWLQSYDKKSIANNVLCQCSCTNSLTLGMPTIYQDALIHWQTIMKIPKSVSKKECLNQNLLGNHKIIFKKNPIFFRHWAESGITKISNI